MSAVAQRRRHRASPCRGGLSRVRRRVHRAPAHGDTCGSDTSRFRCRSPGTGTRVADRVVPRPVLDQPHRPRRSAIDTVPMQGGAVWNGLVDHRHLDKVALSSGDHRAGRGPAEGVSVFAFTGGPAKGSLRAVRVTATSCARSCGPVRDATLTSPVRGGEPPTRNTPEWHAGCRLGPRRSPSNPFPSPSTLPGSGCATNTSRMRQGCQR
jgi:hypothetical protein